MTSRNSSRQKVNIGNRKEREGANGQGESRSKTEGGWKRRRRQGGEGTAMVPGKVGSGIREQREGFLRIK